MMTALLLLAQLNSPSACIMPGEDVLAAVAHSYAIIDTYRDRRAQQFVTAAIAAFGTPPRDLSGTSVVIAYTNGYAVEIRFYMPDASGRECLYWGANTDPDSFAEVVQHMEDTI